MFRIGTKRVYEQRAAGDGKRVLVDRLWPRGIRRDDPRIDEWMKELGPTTELRTWFGHDPDKWREFKERYFEELRGHRDLIEQILRESRKRPVTLLSASREERYNNAAALKEYLAAETAKNSRRLKRAA